MQESTFRAFLISLIPPGSSKELTSIVWMLERMKFYILHVRMMVGLMEESEMENLYYCKNRSNLWLWGCIYQLEVATVILCELGSYQSAIPIANYCLWKAWLNNFSNSSRILKFRNILKVTSEERSECLRKIDTVVCKWKFTYSPRDRFASTVLSGDFEDVAQSFLHQTSENLVENVGLLVSRYFLLSCANMALVPAGALGSSLQWIKMKPTK